MFSLKLFFLAGFIKLGVADAIYQNRNLNHLSQIDKARMEAEENLRSGFTGELSAIYEIMLQNSDKFQFVKEGLKNQKFSRRPRRSGRRSQYRHLMNQRFQN